MPDAAPLAPDPDAEIDALKKGLEKSHREIEAALASLPSIPQMDNTVLAMKTAWRELPTKAATVAAARVDSWISLAPEELFKKELRNGAATIFEQLWKIYGEVIARGIKVPRKGYDDADLSLKKFLYANGAEVANFSKEHNPDAWHIMEESSTKVTVRPAVLFDTEVLAKGVAGNFSALKASNDPLYRVPWIEEATPVDEPLQPPVLSANDKPLAQAQQRSEAAENMTFEELLDALRTPHAAVVKAFHDAQKGCEFDVKLRDLEGQWGLLVSGAKDLALSNKLPIAARKSTFLSHLGEASSAIIHESSVLLTEMLKVPTMKTDALEITNAILAYFLVLEPHVNVSPMASDLADNEPQASPVPATPARTKIGMRWKIYAGLAALIGAGAGGGLVGYNLKDQPAAVQPGNQNQPVNPAAGQPDPNAVNTSVPKAPETSIVSLSLGRGLEADAKLEADGSVLVTLRYPGEMSGSLYHLPNASAEIDRKHVGLFSDATTQLRVPKKAIKGKTLTLMAEFNVIDAGKERMEKGPPVTVTFR